MDNLLNLDTQGGDILLLKFTSQVALDESGLTARRSMSANQKFSPVLKSFAKMRDKTS